VRVYADRTPPEDAVLRIALLAFGAHRALQSIGAPDMDMKLWAAIAAPKAAPDCGGIRLLDAKSGGWRVIRPELLPDDLEAIMLQRALSKAPLVLLFTADFEDAVAKHGARGYREIISRAGSMAARSLMAAEADGLVACPWGGLTEDAWGDLLRIDRYTDCPLFGVSIGYPQDAA
jgi:nitroreductase